jgi:Recombination, repair and ssDNA binding protein UvsY
LTDQQSNGTIIEMNFDKLREMAEQDLAIDNSELGNESTRIPQLHQKYLNYFYDARLSLRKYESDYNTLRRDKVMWLSGKMSEEELSERGWEPCQLRILRTDMDMHMSADPDISSLEAKIALQQEKVSYLESILKMITNRHWQIRNAIEWRKFVSGVS